jgi:hypothetical protein
MQRRDRAVYGSQDARQAVKLVTRPEDNAVDHLRVPWRPSLVERDCAQLAVDPSRSPFSPQVPSDGFLLFENHWINRSA